MQGHWCSSACERCGGPPSKNEPIREECLAERGSASGEQLRGCRTQLAQPKRVIVQLPIYLYGEFGETDESCCRRKLPRGKPFQTSADAERNHRTAGVWSGLRQ